jgi:mannose-1-phosphate guanylyltransferase
LPESTRSSRETTDPHLWITILAGGAGSRFWPVSTPARPKQLLPLATAHPLIADTVARARALAPDERIRVLASRALTPALASALPALSADSFWQEPEARGTGPALLWAAWRIHRLDPDAVMVSLHADHVIRPTDAFVELIRQAARAAAAEDFLVTVGAPPDRPEVGFGYIQPGEPLPLRGGVRAHHVARFHEKPDRATAERYVSEGYLWNTGLFVWRAATFLDEVRRHAPALAALLPLLESGEEPAFFARAPAVTVDVAVLERSDRVAVLAASFAWDDVGSWEALARTLPADADGNVSQGRLHAIQATGNVVFSEDAPVVLFGVHDLVVVRTGGVTLVASRACAPELKSLLDRLPETLKRLD